MARGYKTRNGAKGVVLDRHYMKVPMIEIADIIKRKLIDHKRVCIEGFGCFELRRMAGRKFRNGETGMISVEPPHTRVKFKPSLPFKNLINERK